MKCPHCAADFFDNWHATNCVGGVGTPNGDTIRYVVCPACNRMTVDIHDRFSTSSGQYSIIYPQGLNRGPVSDVVPDEIAEDYREACAIAVLSPKASAALARRCLQSMLNEKGYNAATLHRQVKLFIEEKDPDKIAPASIRQVVDGIRNFGNFGAHPINEVQTLSIIPVEDHEVEWSLAIIERLFRFFYVDPAEDADRKLKLDDKLKKAGKPPSQG